MKGLRAAVGFLTILPVHSAGSGPEDAYQPGDLGRAAAWYPLVGLVIGALLGGAALLLRALLPAPVTAVLVTALWALLTGGLHLDGLADCGDGLLSAVPRERRLEIMRDPRLGTFGGMSLALHLLLKSALVSALLADHSPNTLLAALLAAPALARWLILIVARQPMARPGGLGAEFALGLSRRIYVYAALVPLALLGLGAGRVLLAALLAHLVMLAIVRLARARLGGVTGDVLGLVIELGEAFALLAFVAYLPGW